MKHLLDIESLDAKMILGLIDRAFEFKKNKNHPQYPADIALLFYENSTRTRLSFELACSRLGMHPIHLDIRQSSEQKGETVLDTLYTLAAMGVDMAVIRHWQNGLPTQMSETIANLHIINAGDGQHAHPSQALLDMMTILQHRKDPSQLKITLIGDIRHSRVAQSWQWMAEKMNIGELCMVAPPLWQPQTHHYGRITASLNDGLEDADVIICLRVQQERLTAAENLDLTSFRQGYALTPARLALAKPDSLVMHPGPINRGIEIDNAVADGTQSVILDQVKNGVFMRMAILESIIVSR